MGTFNGIGTKFYGFSQADNAGICTATNWITFLYFPIFPLGRVQLLRYITKPNEFRYQVISRQPLQVKEVIKTYLFGWVIAPILWFWPLIICIREVADFIGIPPSEFHGFANKGSLGIYEGLIVFAIIYLVIFTWKWKDWDEKRGLPK